MSVRIREVLEADLPIFFDQQLDPEANQMAAFTSRDPSDRRAFDAHWQRLLDDASIVKRSIDYRGIVAGSIIAFERAGEPEITYWIGRRFWGKGVATEALQAFLREFRKRPLHARVAKDNLASLRVLEKCGFAICGEDRGFANARQEVIEEHLLVLNKKAS